MKNEYIKGGSDPNAGGYGYGNHSGNYAYGTYGGNYGYGGNEQSPQRSLRDYILIFRERIWWLIVTFFIIFSGSLLYTFNKTKVYTAVSTVRLLRDDPSAMGVSVELAQNQIMSAEDLNTQISVLNSGRIIQAVERRMSDEQRKAFLLPYEGVFSFSGPLTPAEILGKYRKIIPQRMSLMVNVAYIHPDPQIAADVANLFAEAFIDYNLDENIAASMNAVEGLKNKADQYKERVEDIELKLAEYREKHNAVSLDSQENIAREQLGTLNAIELQAKNLYDQIDTKWNLIETYKRDNRKLWELSFIAEEPRVSGLLDGISLIRIEISSLGMRYREKHPLMIQLLQKLQESEFELEQAVTDAVNKIYATYIESKTNFELASQRLAEKEQELISLSKTRVEYNTLLRDFEVEESLFLNINSRMTQEKAQVSLKEANALIVDKALAPLHHSSPNIIINLLVGMVGGLGLGSGLIFLVAFLDDRIKSAFDIEGTIGLPLLGVVPRIKRLDSSTKAQAVAANVDRHVTETFRSINSSLNISDESKKAKIILTTSTVPSEGKSFVSSNLALTFANHGERTLLLDGDLRLPNVASSLKLDNSKGLLDHIQDGASLDDLIIREVFPNFDVLPTGGKSKNPSQVLVSTQFEAMLAELRGRYDRIVIDTAPLAAVSDALNVLPFVDGIIYVIKFNTVKRKTALVNVRRLWESNTPIFGAVLNNITTALSSYYYSQYSDKSYQEYYIGQEDELEDEMASSTEPEVKADA